MDPHGDYLERDEAGKPLLLECYSSEHNKDYISLEAQQGPLLRNKTSDWRAPLIILGFEYLHNIAFSGVATNLTVYLSTVLHGSNSSNARNATTWSGTCFLTPLIGALIADTYLGRYKTIVLSGLIYILGIGIITISSFIPSLKPPPCDGSTCQPANFAQNGAFFLGLYLVAFGNGGAMSALLPFGADQFNEENPIEREKKESFFTWRYFCVTLGGLTSGTLIVWVEQYVSWSLGFSIALSCLALGFGGFILGTTTYRKQMPSGSPLKSIAQVLSASFLKMRLKVPKDDNLLYEEEDNKNTNVPNEQRLTHTDQFRFLDKAAIISNSDLKEGNRRVSWRLCTITQVEELKLLVRLLPIWATILLYTAAFAQISTTFVEQGSAMDNKIGSFSIPPASMPSFMVVSAMTWAVLYEKAIVPATRRCFKNPDGLSVLQRMGLGHFLMILTMSVAACMEAIRLKRIKTGKSISIAWQMPQYFIIGGSEVFFYISQSILFYNEAPHRMKSVCAAFSMLSLSLGGYLSSLIVTLVEHLTTSGGSLGWIPDDLNRGHLDYFFWSLACLCTLNFLAFLAFTKNYTPRKAVLEK